MHIYLSISNFPYNHIDIPMLPTHLPSGYHNYQLYILPKFPATIHINHLVTYFHYYHIYAVNFQDNCQRVTFSYQPYKNRIPTLMYYQFHSTVPFYQLFRPHIFKSNTSSYHYIKSRSLIICN